MPIALGRMRPPSAKRGRRKAALRLEIKSTFLLQKSEVAENVLLDFMRLGFGIDHLQVRDDLLDGVFAVAALDDLQTRAVEAQRALRHKQSVLSIVFSIRPRSGRFRQPAAGRETRPALQIGRHQDSLAGWKAPGGGQPGLT